MYHIIAAYGYIYYCHSVTGMDFYKHLQDTMDRSDETYNMKNKEKKNKKMEKK
jgi:hypothetical protein